MVLLFNQNSDNAMDIKTLFVVNNNKMQFIQTELDFIPKTYLKRLLNSTNDKYIKLQQIFDNLYACYDCKKISKEKYIIYTNGIKKTINSNFILVNLQKKTIKPLTEEQADYILANIQIYKTKKNN